VKPIGKGYGGFDIYPTVEKRYKCDRCGYISKQSTNTFEPTWSWDRVNVCPNCPPWAKYPQFGGQTTWTCIDTPDMFPDEEAGEQSMSEAIFQEADALLPSPSQDTVLFEMGDETIERMDVYELPSDESIGFTAKVDGEYIEGAQRGGNGFHQGMIIVSNPQKALQIGEQKAKNDGKKKAYVEVRDFNYKQLRAVLQATGEGVWMDRDVFIKFRDASDKAGELGPDDALRKYPLDGKNYWIQLPPGRS